MILDVYRAEDRCRFSGSIVLAGMALAHRLFEFKSLAVLFDHFQRGATKRWHDSPFPRTIENDVF